MFDTLDARRYILERIVENDAGCWVWQLSSGSHGYGQGFYLGANTLAHRICFEVFRNTIPEGMTIHHVCRTRKCVNPYHLQVLPNEINAADNGQSSKTHCPKNHEYSSWNTYIDPKGHRRCRKCIYLNNKKRRLMKQGTS